MFALLLSVFTTPISAFAQGGGSIWTNIGPCSSPQNVNQYEVGQDFFGHGSNFEPDTSYTWVVKNPGINGTVHKTGSVVTDENGNFCESLFEIMEDLVGGPYQFVVDGKNDNFSVVATTQVLGCTDELAINFDETATEDDGLCTYELTITKIVTGVEVPDYTAFSFMVDDGDAIPFESDGTNVVIVGSTTHNVVESEAVGYLTTYSNCSPVVFTQGEATCTITNTPAGEVKYGTLVVEKAVVGVEVPDYTAFSFMVDDGGATAFEQDGTNELQLAVGTYTITETPVDGYTTTYTNCEEVQVLENATTTCTVTNTVVTGGIQVCAVGDNLLVNGSFEEPVVSGQWEIFSTIVGWVTSLSDGLELWRNFMGGASDGDQNAELDGNSATRVSQTVATVPGATYELRFDFSPRPNTTLADNVVEAAVDGSALMTVTGDGMSLGSTDWTTHSATFVASTTLTDIAFEDKGTGTVAYGSLIDNTVLCFVSAPTPMDDNTPVVTTSGGGGGGVRLIRSTPTVAGDSISTPAPTPLVLGEQVSQVPFGAPGTGNGGTSSNMNVLSLFQILFVSRKTELTK
jgi:hypothetical protein